MHIKARSYITFIIIAGLFAACSKVPDNAKYVPADATAVAGINLKSLSKKIAWNVITGSKLYKEMQERMSVQGSADAMKGIENAGIDVSNTFYIYTRSDTRFSGGNLLVALVPLADAARWEAYVKQVFPAATIQTHQDRKEAALGDGMYVGWDAHILIILNGTSNEGDIVYADDEKVRTPDGPALMPAEMARAFSVPTGNTIVNNKRFETLVRKGHDLSFWLNYGNLLTDLAGNMSIDFNGVSLSSASWRDAVLTTGFDFKKGQITGDISYYLPAQVEEATKDFGTVKTDKDLLDRLPKEELDMLVSMHISPAGVKTLLEKAGLFGPANVGLTMQGQGLDVDYVLAAFTGDMVIAMHNFSLRAVPQRDSFMGQMVEYKKQKATMNMTYAVKINNHENFSRLLQMTAGGQMLKNGNGYVLPLTYDDTVHLQVSKQYAIMSNSRAYAAGIIDGAYKGKSMPSAIDNTVYDNPFAIYLDIKQMFGKVDPTISSSPRDSAIITESKKLLDNISLYGGNYTEKAYKFNLEINFVDKDENSILELMGFGMRMNDLRNLPD